MEDVLEPTISKVFLQPKLVLRELSAHTHPHSHATTPPPKKKKEKKKVEVSSNEKVYPKKGIAVNTLELKWSFFSTWLLSEMLQLPHLV